MSSRVLSDTGAHSPGGGAQSGGGGIGPLPAPPLPPPPPLPPAPLVAEPVEAALLVLLVSLGSSSNWPPHAETVMKMSGQAVLCIMGRPHQQSPYRAFFTADPWWARHPRGSAGSGRCDEIVPADRVVCWAHD